MWAITLAAVGGCAFFLAQAAGTVLAADAVPMIEQGGSAEKIESTAADRLHRGTHAVDTVILRDIQKIVQRNIFCSTCSPALDSLPENPAGPVSPEIIPTTLPFQLVATLISDEDSRWSFAVLLHVPAEKTILAAVNTRVPGDAVITSITPSRILLRRGGGMEYLELGLKTGKEPAPRAGRASKPARPEAGEGIRRLAEGRYELSRTMVDSLLNDTSALASSVHIVPSVNKGKPDGFRLLRVRARSVPALLGLQRGDTIHAINGRAIKTPEDALSVYTALRKASHITIDLTRNKAPLTHDYTIR